MGFDGIHRERHFFSRVEVVLSLCAEPILDQPVQGQFCRRMSSFNLLLLLRFGVLALMIPAQRDTLILELVGVNASNMQVQFFSRFSFFITLQARRAARGLPRDAAPRPMPSHLTPSPFSPLPPFLYSLPCPGRGCGWMWVGREGGRGHPRAHRHLFHLTFTRRSPDARPGARSTLARLLHVDTAGAAVVTERARGGRPFLPLKPDSQWRPIQGIRGRRIWFDRLLNSTTSLSRVSVATPSAVF